VIAGSASRGAPLTLAALPHVISCTRFNARKATTTQNDIVLGLINILVDFAPMRLTEFVIVPLKRA